MRREVAEEAGLRNQALGRVLQEIDPVPLGIPTPDARDGQPLKDRIRVVGERLDLEKNRVPPRLQDDRLLEIDRAARSGRDQGKREARAEDTCT